MNKYAHKAILLVNNAQFTVLNHFRDGMYLPFFVGVSILIGVIFVSVGSSAVHVFFLFLRLLIL